MYVKCDVCGYTIDVPETLAGGLCPKCKKGRMIELTDEPKEHYEEIDDKIAKLWKLLESHTRELERLVMKLRVAISNKNSDAVGDLAGQIEVIATSDVCYTITIEVLEDLRKT